jgi:hypothetical protein
MASIDTLIPDIQKLLKADGWMNSTLSMEFADEVSKRLQEQYQERTEAPTLRLSQMGPRCPCALWHSIHTPDEAEPLPPWAKFKYSFGHIIEALAITLAKAAGHDVTGEQSPVYVDGIRGHRDCVIDGCVVDVKSASSFSFKKFKDKTLSQEDTFGYLDQLDGYLVGSADDPTVVVKDKGYLLAIDKQLGHMVLYEHRLRESSIRDRIKEYKRISEMESPPRCTCQSVADGKSGNLKLDTKASYSAFKFACNPGIRTFLYANGPVYLTKVVRKPDVTEIDRHGKIIHSN